MDSIANDFNFKKNKHVIDFLFSFFFMYEGNVNKQEF
jgi:hypothetical protein